MRLLLICPALWMAFMVNTQGGSPAPAARTWRERHVPAHDIEALFVDYLDERFRMRPLEATQLGDHRFDDRLDDISAESRTAWLDHDRRTLAELERRFGAAILPPDARLDYEIFRDDLIRSIWLGETFDPFRNDPRVYGSYLSDSVYSLLAQSTLPQDQNVANATARMRQFPAIVATAKQSIGEPPKSVLETAVLQNRGAIGFYRADIFELAGPAADSPDFRQAATEAVVVLEDYGRFLEKEVRPRATGEWRIGAERFARKFALVTDLEVTAEELVAEAEREFQRVQGDMVVIARQLWGTRCPGRPMPPDDPAGRQQLVAGVVEAIGRDHGPPESLVPDARAVVDRLRTFIRDNDILRLPEPDRCRIIEMPAFRRGNSLAYLEAALPLDPAGTSYYAISPPPESWDPDRVRTFLEEYNRHMLEVLSIHEAYPGHYVQLEYANRVPSLIRRIIGSGTFIEGWAVYTERMMLDQGYGAEDASLRLSQLKFFLRAVANAILDYRMHCSGWTDDEALAFLIRDAYQTEGEARLKVVRAKQSSVQLSTYFAGRTAVVRLRNAIQRQLGDAFDLGQFHEAVLAHGSVPVKFLPGLVRQKLGLKTQD
jgi:uncharacterized protein (DUF885 family)